MWTTGEVGLAHAVPPLNRRRQTEWTAHRAPGGIARLPVHESVIQYTLPFTQLTATLLDRLCRPSPLVLVVLCLVLTLGLASSIMDACQRIIESWYAPDIG